MNTTSVQTSLLAEPHGDNRISERTLGYVAEATRDELYDMLVRACSEAGITKATIAKRLGKDPAQITRLLSASNNWTIDTLSELLFAIDGRMLCPNHVFPMREAKTNLRAPTCFGNLDREATHTTPDRWVIVTYDKKKNITKVATPGLVR